MLQCALKKGPRFGGAPVRPMILFIIGVSGPGLGSAFVGTLQLLIFQVGSESTSCGGLQNTCATLSGGADRNKKAAKQDFLFRPKTDNLNGKPPVDGPRAI